MLFLRAALISAVSTVSLVAAQGAGGMPQCVKGEYGCDYSAAAPATFGTHSDAFGMSVGITRYKPGPGLGDSGVYCGEGNKFGDTVTVHKDQCVNFDEAPIDMMSWNYKLPNNKMLNHCDITMYDGKDCRGKITYELYGTQEVQTVNGQRYCHRAPWTKSVFLGPCV